MISPLVRGRIGFFRGHLRKGVLFFQLHSLRESILLSASYCAKQFPTFSSFARLFK